MSDNDTETGLPPSEPAAPLIARAPLALRCPERLISLVAPLLGVILGIGASLLCFQYAVPGGILAKTFDPHQSHSLIPYAIFCMFFWAITICCFRLWRLRALARVTDRALLVRAIETLQSEDGLSRLAVSLQTESCAASPMLRRLLVVVEQWILFPGLQEAEVVLANQVALDADASQRGYSLVRVMVWALPVLGLVGTVLGIADAVGGFANFLGQNINDVKEIRTKLVEVTGGLSFAFLITLQGLLTSLIAMLLVSGLQSREDRLFGEIQRSIAEMFLPILQRVSPAIDARPVHPWQEWIDELATATAAAVSAIRSAAEGVLQNLAKTGESCTTAVDAAAQSGIGSITDTAVHAVHQLETVSDTAMSAVNTVAQQGSAAVAGTAEQAVRHLTSLTEASVAAVDTTAQHGIRSMAETGATARAGMRDERTAHAAQIESLLLRSSTLLETWTASLTDALTSQAVSAQKVSAATENTGTILQKTVQVQTELEKALARTEKLASDKTLDSLRATVDRIGPILTRFQQPFVLQAVPMPQ